MKLQLPLSILSAALLAAPSVFGQATTKPVGFQTVTLKANAFNLVGVNFLKPALVVGVLDSLSATSITDADVNLSTALTGQTNLVVEITSGSGAGLWANVTSVATNQLTVDSDLTATVSGGASYQVFSLPTLADIFGASNSSGIKAGNAASADIIWLSTGNGSGTFDKYYYATATFPFTAGWKNVNTGNTNAANTPVYHHEAMLIQRREVTDLALTFSGAVKTSPTTIPIFTGYNYVERSFPALATLGNCGLSAFLTHGNAASADIVWLPNSSGAYDKYFYATATFPFTAGWKNVNTGNTDASSTALTTGFIIQRRGGNTNLKLTPDAAYSSL
ncbi:MAG: TIGR02597 family protein [Verrucomicrobiaceae bacterium]|nr:TIGR02597 family protein [Verrucomicrobiaceae bacterium]